MAAHSYSFPKSRRIRSRAEFSAVFEARIRESRGPLTIYSVPNTLPHPRLGMSVSAKVGTAVQRNRIKRLLRDAFRLQQHDLPAGYDFIIVVRPHQPLVLAEYQKLLSALTLKLHAVWQQRARRAAGPQGPARLP